MIQLRYSLPHDKYQTVTVLGDAKGIWDLWWRLTNVAKDNKQSAVTDIKITNLNGIELDPRRGMDECWAYDMPLSKIDN